MKQLLTIALSFLWIGCNLFAQKTIAEQLGYPADAKLLIIHADDLGVIHTVNQATFRAFADGSVRSASIMVPTPWLPEVAAYAKEHPDHDLGIHLTLTSEWEYLRWGPVAPAGQVSSLLDENGYFYPNCAQLWEHAKIEEVEMELRAQIKKAIAMGIQPTHLDSHMGCLFSSDPRYYELYVKLAKEFGIPAMVNHQIEQLGGADGTKMPVVINDILGANIPDYESSMSDYYANALRNLKPGVHVMIIHCGYDNMESQGMSYAHPYWGAQWRQQDFDFFTSDACANILKEENIHVVTWKELGSLLKK